MSRKPDYSVGALDKRRDARQPKIGVAWRNDDGTISVVIDPFVVLHGGPDLVVTMFPIDPEADAARPTRRSPPQVRRATPVDQDEEIPF